MWRSSSLLNQVDAELTNPILDVRCTEPNNPILVVWCTELTNPILVVWGTELTNPIWVVWRTELTNPMDGSVAADANNMSPTLDLGYK